MRAVTIAKGQVRNPMRKVGWKIALGMGQVMAHEMTLPTEPSMWPWITLVIERLSLNGMIRIGT